MTEDHWNAGQYGETVRFVTDLGAPVLDLLNPQSGERILDLGCGDGVLTAKIAACGADVIGVDSSEDMISAAKDRGLTAFVADAQALTFDQEFDAVFSNAALHWMTDATKTLQGIAASLKPGGRVVAEQGGHGNVAAIRTALISVLSDFGVRADLFDIWSFPSVEIQTRRLRDIGLLPVSVELIPRPTPVASGMEAWLEALSAPALAKIDPELRPSARSKISTLLAPALRDADGNWTADYVRLRFKAVKE